MILVIAMPRPPKCRWVRFIPGTTLFRPVGVPGPQLQEVVLSVEELEALRLKDLEGRDQEQCAASMQISRPTFQRLLESAHRKVAEALTAGKGIRIQGGNFRVRADALQRSPEGTQAGEADGPGAPGPDLGPGPARRQGPCPGGAPGHGRRCGARLPAWPGPGPGPT